MIEILSERLTLTEEFKPYEIRQHVSWLNDPSLMRWSDQRYKFHTMSTQKDFIARAAVSGNPLCLNIRISGGDTIGTIHADINHMHRRTDIGIMIGSHHQKKGYATEAWRAVENHLAEIGICKFEAGCVDRNFPMRSLLVSLGYHQEGIRRDHFIVDGEIRDLVMYGKVRK